MSLTPRTVAESLGLSLSKVYALAKSGALPCYRHGKAVRFDAADVEAYDDGRSHGVARRRPSARPASYGSTKGRMAEKVVIGNAELWHGDCREVLPHLSRRIAIVSDPPYGIGFVHSGSTRTSGHSQGVNSPNNAARIVGDDEPFRPGHLLTFEQAILFGADHYAQELPRGRWLAWDKLGGQDAYGDSFSDVEYAWHSKTGAARIFRMVWKGMCQGAGKDKGTKRTHPTQKPVDLMEWCIEQAGRPAVVCDPYMGTGATGVAAMNLGLRFVGVEIHRPYFDIACDRIARAQAQASLLPLHEPAAEAVQQGLELEP